MSNIDMLAQAGVMTREMILAALTEHMLTDAIRLQMHPAVFVAAGYEAFALTIRALMPTERFTELELLSMWECIKHLANNPQELKRPSEMWQTFRERAAKNL